MTDRPIPDVLADCPLLAGVATGGRDRLAAMAVTRTFPAATTIFTQGEPPPGLFIVDHGRVRVFRLAPNGREHVLHVCGPGQTFAEVAVLGEFELPACAEAIDPVRCVLLPAGPLLHALRTDHALCVQMLQGLSRWVRHLVSLLEDIVLRDAAGRVARYLLHSADPGGRIELPSTKRDLASHLNLTSETLSRVLRRFQEASLIGVGEADRELHLQDSEGLAAAADGLFPRL